jgi:hypothetical protein
MFKDEHRKQLTVLQDSGQSGLVLKRPFDRFLEIKPDGRDQRMAVFEARSAEQCKNDLYSYINKLLCSKQQKELPQTKIPSFHKSDQPSRSMNCL